MNGYAYYNEFDPYAAEWLENLIRAKEIADGEIDTRDIREVKADELKGFDQHHFFAGIGGWSFALRLANWPDSRPVWTGSCPCQPFSTAGKQQGTDDDRHLWPAWFELISECRPPVVFGEQVASAIRHGWIDAVYDDLEKEGYACGAAVLPACGVGAPHLRQRLWFVADADRAMRRRNARSIHQTERKSSRQGHFDGQKPVRPPTGRTSGSVADGNSERRDREQILVQPRRPQQTRDEIAGGGGAGKTSGMGDTELPSTTRLRNLSRTRAQPKLRRFGGAGRYGGGVNNVGNALGKGLEGLDGNGDDSHKPGRQQARPLGPIGAPGWSNLEWLPGADGKTRPTQPGIFPLADGLPPAMDGRGPVGRKGALKGAGNAIVPQVAAEFIKAYSVGIETPEETTARMARTTI